MNNRLGVVLGGGWVCAAPFVLLGAPNRWQVLACAMGSLITLILTPRKAND